MRREYELVRYLYSHCARYAEGQKVECVKRGWKFQVYGRDRTRLAEPWRRRWCDDDDARLLHEILLSSIWPSIFGKRQLSLRQ